MIIYDLHGIPIFNSMHGLHDYQPDLHVDYSLYLLDIRPLGVFQNKITISFDYAITVWRQAARRNQLLCDQTAEEGQA